ncbi:MAG: hypothetical protein N2560_04220 [Ignavibacteria bacterium]|nr:hypothetical protein [Ignavibacteria bacterium]
MLRPFVPSFWNFWVNSTYYPLCIFQKVIIEIVVNVANLYLSIWQTNLRAKMPKVQKSSESKRKKKILVIALLSGEKQETRLIPWVSLTHIISQQN